MNGVKYIILILGFITLSVQAQTDTLSRVAEDSLVNDTLGYITLVADSSIAKMEASRIYERKVAIEKGLGTKIDGFRIMLSFDQSRAKASRILNSATVRYGETYACVLEYDEPNFKVFMGEFVEYEDAAKVVNVVRRTYPMARVIKDKIKTPPGYFDTEEDE